MPTIKTDHKINLDSLSEAFGNSKSKRLDGSGSQLKSSGGVTGWLKSKLTSKSSQEAGYAAAASKLIWAYKRSTDGLMPSIELEKKINAAVRGGESMQSLIAAMKVASNDVKQRQPGNEYILEAAKAQTPKEIVDAYQKLIAASEHAEPKIPTIKGKHLLEAINKNPNLTPEQKQQVICEIAKHASKSACLGSNNAGSLARQNDVGTNFLTACSQQYLASMGNAVGNVAQEALSQPGLKMPEGVSPPNPGTKNPPGLTPQQAEAYDNASVNCAVEILDCVQQEAQNVSPEAKQYLAAVKEGAIEAALEKPNLAIEEGGKELAPEEVGNRMVQGQILLRVVNPVISDLSGWKGASRNPVHQAEASVLNKLAALPQTFDNYSNGEAPKKKLDPKTGIVDFVKGQDRIVAQMRADNPNLNEAYKQLPNQVSNPVNVDAIRAEHEKRQEEKKANEQKHSEHIEIDDDTPEVKVAEQPKVEDKIEVKAEAKIEVEDQGNKVEPKRLSTGDAFRKPKSGNVMEKAAMFEEIAKHNTPSKKPGGISH